MADAEQRVSTSDLAGRTKPSDAGAPQDVAKDANGTAAGAASRDQDGPQETTPHREQRTTDDGDERPAALVEPVKAADLQEKWTAIQVEFVDRPREAVSRADELVANVMQQVAARFADERSTLEQQWSSGDDVDTEDLRIALQRYRSFFKRLLST